MSPTAASSPPPQVLTPPETAYKLESRHQQVIDDTIYDLTLHFSYDYAKILTPLKHFLKYYSFLHPECSNILESYDDVDFVRERFCFVDYIKWKNAQKGSDKTYTEDDVTQLVHERTVDVQQVNDSLQEQLDRLITSTSQDKSRIEKLQDQFQEALQAQKTAEEKSKNLTSDMQQLNKELDRLRNEVQLYREREQNKQSEKQEQLYKSYQSDGTKPSGYSIFKDSLQDDIARIYSSVKDSLPQIEESSDHEEEDDDEEIYATNLPPATEFESKFGSSLFPRGTFERRPNNSSSTGPRSQVRRSQQEGNGPSNGKFSQHELAAAEKELEEALLKEQSSSTLGSKPKVEDVSLEAIENDLASQDEMKWNAEFENALKKAQSGNEGDNAPANFNVSNQLSNIDLDSVLKSVQGDDAASSQNTASASAPSVKEAWGEESKQSEADAKPETAKQEEQKAPPAVSAREARRRKRMMEIPEHDD